MRRQGRGWVVEASSPEALPLGLLSTMCVKSVCFCRLTVLAHLFRSTATCLHSWKCGVCVVGDGVVLIDLFV